MAVTAVFSLSAFIAQSPSAAKLCILRGFDFSIYDEVVSAFKKEVHDWEIPCDLILKNNQNEVAKLIHQHHPDVVLTLGNSAEMYMQNNFSNTPVISGMAKNVQAGIKKSGIAIEIPYDKQLYLVKQALISLNRVGIIYSAKNLSKAQKFIQAAKRQGIQVNSHAVSNPQEVIRVMPKLQNEDLFWILLDEGVLTVKNRDDILQLANKLGLKTYAFSPVYLKGPHGADLSVSISWSSYGKQMASLAKKMVTNPNKTYPVEEPFDVRVYMKKGRTGLNYDVANIVIVP